MRSPRLLGLPGISLSRLPDPVPHHSALGETVKDDHSDRAFSPLSPMYVLALPSPVPPPDPVARPVIRCSNRDPHPAFRALPISRIVSLPQPPVIGRTSRTVRHGGIPARPAGVDRCPAPVPPRLRWYDARSDESRSGSSIPKSPTGKLSRVESSVSPALRQMPWSCASFW